jgi:protein-tyrosine-phosphatase
VEIAIALLVAVTSLLSADAAPQAAPKPGARPPVVLFICPHGAAKSVMASAYFQKLAKERGLNVRVDAAGTEPQPELSTAVVASLKKDGYAIPIEKPRAATAADMKTADVVISIGCDLSKLPPPNGALKNWNVPDFSDNFDQAQQAIRDQVTALVEELLAKQKTKR